MHRIDLRLRYRSANTSRIVASESKLARSGKKGVPVRSKNLT